MDLEKLPEYFVAITFFYAVSLFAALFYFIAPSLSLGLFAEPDLWIYTALYAAPLVLLYAYMKRGDSRLRVAASALMAVDIIIAVVLIFPLALF